MLKTLLASGVAVSAVALASPAQADGFYINPEYNGAFSGSDFGGGVLDGHVGFEAGAFYIQGGPSVLMPDGGDVETGFSAKTGVTAPVAENLRPVWRGFFRQVRRYGCWLWREGRGKVQVLS